MWNFVIKIPYTMRQSALIKNHLKLCGIVMCDQWFYDYHLFSNVFCLFFLSKKIWLCTFHREKKKRIKSVKSLLGYLQLFKIAHVLIKYFSKFITFFYLFCCCVCVCLCDYIWLDNHRNILISMNACEVVYFQITTEDKNYWHKW